MFPTKSANIYVTLSKETISDYKEKAIHQSKSAIFPKGMFLVGGSTIFDDLTISVKIDAVSMPTE
jgi:hypothetical protein